VTAGEPDPPIHLALDPSLSTVLTDADRLRTVLVNLLMNAREAVSALATQTPPVRMPEVPIEIQTRRLAGDRIGIVVRDRGIGISAPDLQRVFEPEANRAIAGRTWTEPTSAAPRRCR
jgi:signal transduction histidine kinase